WPRPHRGAFGERPVPRRCDERLRKQSLGVNPDASACLPRTHGQQDDDEDDEDPFHPRVRRSDRRLLERREGRRLRPHATRRRSRSPASPSRRHPAPTSRARRLSVAPCGSSPNTLSYCQPAGSSVGTACDCRLASSGRAGVRSTATKLVYFVTSRCESASETISARARSLATGLAAGSRSTSMRAVTFCRAQTDATLGDSAAAAMGTVASHERSCQCPLTTAAPSSESRATVTTSGSPE